MKITVHIKPNSRRVEVRKIDERNYYVSVKSPPSEGKANEELISVLSDFFNKPRRCISILHGLKSKLKIVEIV